MIDKILSAKTEEEFLRLFLKLPEARHGELIDRAKDLDMARFTWLLRALNESY